MPSVVNHVKSSLGDAGVEPPKQNSEHDMRCVKSRDRRHPDVSDMTCICRTLLYVQLTVVAGIETPLAP